MRVNGYTVTREEAGPDLLLIVLVIGLNLFFIKTLSSQ